MKWVPPLQKSWKASQVAKGGRLFFCHLHCRWHWTSHHERVSSPKSRTYLLKVTHMAVPRAISQGGGGIKENFGGASKIGGEWNIAPDVSCKWSKVAGGWWGHKLELALHFYQLWFKTGITPKVPSYQALGSVANSWRHSLEFSLGKQDIKTSLQAPLYDLYPLVLIRQERDSWEWIQWEKPLL